MNRHTRHYSNRSLVAFAGSLLALAMALVCFAPVPAKTNENTVTPAPGSQVNPENMWNSSTSSSSRMKAQNGLNSLDSQSLGATAASVTWGTSSNGKVITDGNGTVWADPAMKVIDVSEHQGTIDWKKVKANGIDAAIIRIGYGNGTEDKQLKANLSGAAAAGMKIGVYLYSYADTTQLGKEEANFVANTLEKYGVTSRLLPIFYDLEDWNSWKDDSGATHSYPKTSAAFTPIVNAFFTTLANRGYSDVNIYTYRTFANQRLNTAALQSKISWIAEYNPTTAYTFPNYSGGRGWQYTSSATVAGISGSVDMSGFDEFIFSDVNARSTPHFADIKWLAQQGITTGFDDGSFHPRSGVQRADMAAFLYRLKGSPSFTPTAAQKTRFSDVTAKTAHYNEIWWLASTGITTGYDDGTFRPTSVIIRQDMAAFLYRIAGSPDYTPSAAVKEKFSDVTESTPHAKEIWWCAENGIANGYDDGTFAPTATIIRQDMAAFLHRISSLVS